MPSNRLIVATELKEILLSIKNSSLGVNVRKRRQMRKLNSGWKSKEQS